MNGKALGTVAAAIWLVLLACSATQAQEPSVGQQVSGTRGVWLDVRLFASSVYSLVRGVAATTRGTRDRESSVAHGPSAVWKMLTGRISTLIS